MQLAVKKSLYVNGEVDVVEKEPRSEINRGAVEVGFDWESLIKIYGRLSVAFKNDLHT